MKKKILNLYIILYYITYIYYIILLTDEFSLSIFIIIAIFMVKKQQVRT